MLGVKQEVIGGFEQNSMTFILNNHFAVLTIDYRITKIEAGRLSKRLLQ